MKQLLVTLLILVAATACMQRPAPVAREMVPVDPSQRVAIEVLYVAVPTMYVYEQPALNTRVVGSYGLTEAISVLEKTGDWYFVRTFTGAGWVPANNLMTGAQLDKFAADATPRFYVAPVTVPFRTRGEIILQAKVNTDGSVVEVKAVKNTTGSLALADSNAGALMAAKFYPLVDKGARKTFVYEHHVYY